ncbi:MAG: flagellar hook-length control protein FliK [Candidatus Melainabacteria bacterium]|nr:flagellar hook-length control protein FliK [Candidatus Melainabacteria bacterium]
MEPLLIADNLNPLVSNRCNKQVNVDEKNIDDSAPSFSETLSSCLNNLNSCVSKAHLPLLPQETLEESRVEGSFTETALEDSELGDADSLFASLESIPISQAFFEPFSMDSACVAFSVNLPALETQISPENTENNITIISADSEGNIIQSVALIEQKLMSSENTLEVASEKEIIGSNPSYGFKISLHQDKAKIDLNRQSSFLDENGKPNIYSENAQLAKFHPQNTSFVSFQKNNFATATLGPIELAELPKNQILGAKQSEGVLLEPKLSINNVVDTKIFMSPQPVFSEGIQESPLSISRNSFGMLESIHKNVLISSIQNSNTDSVQNELDLNLDSEIITAVVVSESTHLTNNDIIDEVGLPLSELPGEVAQSLPEKTAISELAKPSDGVSIKSPKNISAEKINSLEVIEQISNSLIPTVQQKRAQLEISLKPDHLGTVKINFTRAVEGVINATLIVETADVEKVLSENLAMLHQSLERQGIQIGNVRITTPMSLESEKNQYLPYDNSNSHMSHHSDSQSNSFLGHSNSDQKYFFQQNHSHHTKLAVSDENSFLKADSSEPSSEMTDNRVDSKRISLLV